MIDFYNYFLKNIFESEDFFEAKKEKIDHEFYYIKGPEFITLNGLFKKGETYGTIHIDGCPNLENLSNLPNHIYGDLTISSCPRLTRLDGLMNVSEIDGYLNIGGLRKNILNPVVLQKMPKIGKGCIHSNRSFLKLVIDAYKFRKIPFEYAKPLSKVSFEEIISFIETNEIPKNLQIPWSKMVVVPYLGATKESYIWHLTPYFEGKKGPRLAEQKNGYERYSEILRDMGEDPVGFSTPEERRQRQELVEKFLLFRKDYYIPQENFKSTRGGLNATTIVLRVAKDGNFLGYGATEQDIASGTNLVITASISNPPIPADCEYAKPEDQIFERGHLPSSIDVRVGPKQSKRSLKDENPHKVGSLAPKMVNKNLPPPPPPPPKPKFRR